jgi:hypothetical protein
LTVTLIAVFLCAPSLWLGLQIDDYVHRLVLSSPPLDSEWTRSPIDAFNFVDGDRELIQRALDEGRLPWWSHPELKLSFLRPLSSLTHWADFNLWPDHTWLMHLQSLLWFAGAVLAAAMLYRRLLHPTWVAGLASLLFAIDDAHGMPAVWLANRNASIAVFFGLAVLIAHDLWRRGAWRPGAFFAPAALAFGLLAGEMALGTGGYLVAYALFLDSGSWRTRLASLVPCGMVGAGWWVTYRWLGYGTAGSGVYIDPGQSPVEFLQAAFGRAPALFAGLWAVPSGLGHFFSQTATHILWLVTIGLAIGIGLLLLPMLRRDRVARFFCLGMVIALVPSCAAFADDRLLFFASFGGMGVMAQLMAAVWSRDDWVPSSRLRRFAITSVAWILVLIHLVLSPISLASTAYRIETFGRIVLRVAESLPSEPAAANQVAVIVNSPSAFFSIYGPLMQATHGRPTPGRTLVLGSGIYPMAISRPATDVLAIQPEGGFLVPPGSPRPGHEASQPWFHPAYFHQMLDHLYRDATPLSVGNQIAYGGATVEIIESTCAGRPIKIEVDFARDLDDPVFLWLKWKNGVYEPFVLPAAGETVILPSVVIPWQEEWALH